MSGRRVVRSAAVAAIIGGLTWVGLVAGVSLHRAGDLSYDGYYRLVAVPLGVFVVAWALLRPVVPVGRALTGWWLTLAGFGLVFAGATLEFWGSWLLDERTSNTAATFGGDAWWGSDVGWTLFALGFLLLSAGGPTVAVGLRRIAGWPMWACTFLAVVGIGVVLANVLRDAPAAPAAIGLGAFAAGWVALGVRLWATST